MLEKTDYKESWVLKNWRFWTVVLEKTLESPLDFKEIQPVSPKGNQSWIFTGRTDTNASILWPPVVKIWLIWKDPDSGKDWGQEEKGTTVDEMVGWHHRLNGHEFELNSRSWWRTGRPGVLQSMGCKESDTTERLNWNGEDVKKREASYTADVNVNWCSYYGKQCRGSLKT